MNPSRPTSRRPWLRRILRTVSGAAALVSLAGLTLVLAGWSDFGKGPTGERKQRMQSSPQWTGSKFANPQPLYNSPAGMFGFVTRRSKHTRPKEPIPVIEGDGSVFAAAPESGLRVTWFGHSSALVEIDGARVLTDPIWGERSSPISWMGPRRWYDPPVALADLPTIDAVVISHDHYDHLQRETIEAMAGWDTTFVVPLGVGAHLTYWGVPEDQVVELDWWDRTTVGGLEIVATPARHASGRHVLDQNHTLWAGYAFLGAEHRVYYSGDTGLFPGLREIGDRLGPFDLTMIESGAYDRAWPDWHIGPEQAVVAHQLVRGEVMLPVHWGLFNLALHGWTEPIERVSAAGAAAGATVIAPRPGQSIEPATPPAIDRWWPDLPWNSADQDPIRATKVDADALLDAG